MNNKTDIEKDIKKIEKIIGLFYEFPNPTSVSIRDYEVQAIENILADRERLEKENEELLEVKISASAINVISKLEKKLNEENNRCVKFAIENNELQAKANKYDSLVEKIKNKINNLKEEKYILSSREAEIMLLQELLDTEK